MVFLFRVKYCYWNFVTEVNCSSLQNAVVGVSTEGDFRTYVLNILKASRNGVAVDDNDEVRLIFFTPSLHRSSID